MVRNASREGRDGWGAALAGMCRRGLTTQMNHSTHGRAGCAGLPWATLCRRGYWGMGW
jgi:hypothetical protein